MTTFFVGQKVRIIRAHHHPEWIGQEARITRVNCTGQDVDGSFYLGDGIDRINKFGIPVIAPKGSLEPIVPEGMQPVEWSECLWQPEGLHA